MQKVKDAGAPAGGKPSAAAKADPSAPAGRDWSETLFLPKTDFPMKAGLPNLEPRLLQRWEEMKLFRQLRKAAKGREKFILHDGPPYANGHLHIGHALNKILKDTVVRSQTMLGKDSNYVPGWDCHGLPIEWKIEEQYRAKGKNKDEVSLIEFRRECREFAAKWIDIQREEFKRLGVEGDWEHPYLTMSFDAEATIANEIMKFAMNGALYQGSKPVMWSVVERTALAEAEVEYHEHVSPTIFVKFPVAALADKAGSPLADASVVIWTTTPWTIPGNRAIAYSPRIAYGVYQVTASPDDNWAKVGEKLIVADALAENLKGAARIEGWERVADADPAAIKTTRHPFHGKGYDFEVRLYAGDHVTDDTGTGFVHTAPGHGADDYELYIKNKKSFDEAGIPEVPHTVGEDGFYFEHVPMFGGANPKRVIDDKGKFSDANEAVIQALIEAGALVARGRLKHQYPHSWRSKAPVIFRNTPQWFIALDKPIKVKGVKGAKTIRELALKAIEDTRFVPPTGQNRLRGMTDGRPDWVISRQRAWGVPITVFVHKKTGEVIPNAGFAGASELISRIVTAFEDDGADAWFAEGARERLLAGLVSDPAEWDKVDDILDVWFESGSTHAFVLEKRKDLGSPAALYLEGSDQHRGWFASSLMESCGTRGRAPFEAVLTHGFILDEKGDEKMSKSKGNVLSPQDVTKQSGSEILRLWVASADYSGDIRFGPGIVQASTESYRKLRNTLRFMLGNLAHDRSDLHVPYAELPELERFMLHRLWELDSVVRKAYENFDFKRVFSSLFNFSTGDLSALYFDIRKDTLYCEPASSLKRRATLTVLNELFTCLTTWLAPILCFTSEEAYLARFPEAKDSVHLKTFPAIPAEWRDEALAEKWQAIWKIRQAVTGALEVERREKRIGSSLEAAPTIYIADEALFALAKGEDWAEIAITSAAALVSGKPPAGAFTLDEVAGVAVVPGLAEGRKCARSWKISPEVGSDPEFPDLSPRDAAAVREFDASRGAA
ncbi:MULTISPECIES: isoleucine--tRNA ligase [Rhodomicrobium]|uniref:isoleucine--tRNA ligase n=1 Tax=Rhodomicrobium TaxID=1068 RepID=UPI000B4B9F3E|nr:MULTISPECIES: isoleucine--tRNA ligase [Rhodomicrobium]